MATKLSIKDAVQRLPVSESTLRRDMKNGKVSSEKDPQGRRWIDAAELTRVYGERKSSNTPPEQSMHPGRAQQLNALDTTKSLALLEGQVQDLKHQLDIATKEKAQLLDLLKAEKAEKHALMPPPDEKKRRQNGWLRRLVGT